MAWELSNERQVPPGMQVNHRCDNKRCVNPNHLYVGTQLDNMHDRRDRGRIPKTYKKRKSLEGVEVTVTVGEDRDV